MFTVKFKQWLTTIPLALVAMIVMSFSIFSASALAVPQDLVNWCVGIDDCDVALMEDQGDKFVGEVFLHGAPTSELDLEKEALHQCRDKENLPWGADSTHIDDDAKYYFATENYLIDFECSYPLFH